jgi:hypothetical protein
MRIFSTLCFFFAVTLGLTACKFSCTVGNKEDEKGAVKIQDGARTYNNIELNAHNVKVSKAYLALPNGTRVPDDNFVDFKSPIKVVIRVDSGWVEQNGKVMLGASEKIMAEDGTLLLDESDLFSVKYADGVSVADSKTLGLTASIQLKPNTPPTSFIVSFRIWDKGGDGYIVGSYKLFSK